MEKTQQGEIKKPVILSGEWRKSLDAGEVCTLQVHWRKRIGGKLRSAGSKSLTIVNASLKDGLKIIKLGIDAFRAAR